MWLGIGFRGTKTGNKSDVVANKRVGAKKATSSSWRTCAAATTAAYQQSRPRNPFSRIPGVQKSAAKKERLERDISNLSNFLRRHKGKSSDSGFSITMSARQ